MQLLIPTQHDLIQEPVLQDHSTSYSHTGSELEAIQPIMANKFADNEDNDGDIVAGPTVEAHVHLAKTASMCFNHYND
jgi:hypothetical protein